MKKIYTIGYEGKSKNEFFQILEENGITRLIDVRSYPTSQREEFNKDNLKNELFRKSIQYEHLPELGGLREGDYKEAMKEEEWKEAYKKLKQTAEEGKTVMMCLEKDPMQCHRRHITEKLSEEGWEVLHIGKGGSWKEKKLDDFGN